MSSAPSFTSRSHPGYTSSKLPSSMSRLFGTLLAALALVAVPAHCRTLFQVGSTSGKALTARHRAGFGNLVSWRYSPARPLPPRHMAPLHHALEPNSQAATPVRWCIPAAANPAAVAACTTAVARANSATVSFSCLAGGSEEGCMQLIANRSADLTTLGGALQRVQD